MSACDALDGVLRRQILTDPRRCRFEPSTLLCRGSDMEQCLTAPQMEAVKMGYRPAEERQAS